MTKKPCNDTPTKNNPSQGFAAQSKECDCVCREVDQPLLTFKKYKAPFRCCKRIVLALLLSLFSFLVGMIIGGAFGGGILVFVAPISLMVGLLLLVEWIKFLCNPRRKCC